MRIAFVTYTGLPLLSADDRLALAPLGERDIVVDAAAWDDPAVAWGSYDALVVRSTWNYHTALDRFRRWIDDIELLGVPLWNPPAVLRWNADKAYLRGLAERGTDVVATRWIDRGSSARLAEVMAEAGWSDAVVKPAVSASAHETWRAVAARLTEEDETRFRRVVNDGDVMVQPFLLELAREGEWSLMFLAGQYSHAVLKRPRAGDFRVQEHHGGSAEPRTPPAQLIAAARDISARVESPWLYARVDGCEVAGRFVLVELEMLEPSLFLAADPAAPERFAETIERILGTRN